MTGTSNTYRLLSERECVNYVAAYLKYFQDRWKDKYPKIDKKKYEENNPQAILCIKKKAR